jgi:hypothetical protein
VTETPSPSIEERLAALEVLASVPVILGPGETLIIRVTDLTPNQVREYQDALDYREADGILPFRAIVVYGHELAAARAAPEPPAAPSPSFMDDVREDVSRSGSVEAARLTHLPTGVTGEGGTREAAVADLVSKLTERGGISINAARAALGLKPFAGDFANQPLDLREPPVFPG